MLLTFKSLTIKLVLILGSSRSVCIANIILSIQTGHTCKQYYIVLSEESAYSCSSVYSVCIISVTLPVIMEKNIISHQYQKSYVLLLNPMIEISIGYHRKIVLLSLCKSTINGVLVLFLMYTSQMIQISMVC